LLKNILTNDGLFIFGWRAAYDCKQKHYLIEFPSCQTSLSEKLAFILPGRAGIKASN